MADSLPPPQRHTLDNVALLARIVPFAAISNKRLIELAFVCDAFNDCIVNYQEHTFQDKIKKDSQERAKMKKMVTAICSRGHVELTRAAALHKCTIGLADTNGWTPLHHAVFHRRMDVVRLIVSTPHAPVNYRNNMGWTPIRCAVYPHGDDALRLLEILCGRKLVDINSTCNDGWTPLHAAAQLNRPDIVSFLLDRGAAADIKVQKTGYTPLVMAIVNHSVGCVELLLRKGKASLSCRLVETGRTPILAAIAGRSPHFDNAAASTAAGSDSEKIIELLLQTLHEREGTAKAKETLSETMRDDKGKTAQELLGTCGNAKIRGLMFL